MTKLTSLTEAVKTIQDGSHLALSGFAITRCTMAFAREVIRQDKRKLTVSQCVGAMDADILVGAGCVEHIIYGGGSLDRFGRLACVNRAIEKKPSFADEYSSLSVAFRYLAGSLGLPFIPIRSLQGSDLMKKLKETSVPDISSVKDPFTHDEWPVLKPLLPDVCVVQVQTADEEGNATIKGPRWDNAEQARASKRTIVIAEKIVPTEEMRQDPDRVVIPGILVSHVVELPFGAHPSSVYGEYDYDARQIQAYAAAARSEKDLQAYLKETIHDVKNHQEYLDRLGNAQYWRELRADKMLGY